MILPSTCLMKLRWGEKEKETETETDNRLETRETYQYQTITSIWGTKAGQQYLYRVYRRRDKNHGGQQNEEANHQHQYHQQEEFLLEVLSTSTN